MTTKTKMLSRLWTSLFFLTIGILFSCEPQTVDQIPFVEVEIDINLNNVDYVDLQLDGGYVYELGGVRGLIIYRENFEEYRTFERNSPVNPSDVCSTLDVDSSGLFIIDPCHNIAFDFDGLPISGGSLPLRQYLTILDGNWLYIRSEPGN